MAEVAETGRDRDTTLILCGCAAVRFRATAGAI
jgi:hypothetical protein